MKDPNGDIQSRILWKSIHCLLIASGMIFISSEIYKATSEKNPKMPEVKLDLNEPMPLSRGGWSFSGVDAIVIDDSRSAEKIVEAIRESGQITNVVNLLISSGEFCNVRGHDWAGGCGVVGCLVYHQAPMRHCRTCGLTQTQEVGSWK